MNQDGRMSKYLVVYAIVCMLGIAYVVMKDFPSNAFSSWNNRRPGDNIQYQGVME